MDGDARTVAGGGARPRSSPRFRIRQAEIPKTVRLPEAATRSETALTIRNMAQIWPTKNAGAHEPHPGKEKPRLSGAFSRALCRTRTGDPFLTMEVLYQLS